MTGHKDNIVKVFAAMGVVSCFFAALGEVAEMSCERENNVYDCVYNGHTRAWEPIGAPQDDTP